MHPPSHPTWLPAVVALAAVSGVLFAQPPGFTRPPIGGMPTGPGAVPPQPAFPTTPPAPIVPRGGIGGAPGNEIPRGGVPPMPATPVVPPMPKPPEFPAPRGPVFRGAPGTQGGPNDVGEWECDSCHKAFTATGKPSKCPHCNVTFDKLVDENGQTIRTPTTTTTTSTRGIGKLIGLGIGLVILAVGGLIGLIKALAGGGSKPGRKVKKKRKPVVRDDDEDYDDEEDDRPRRRSRRD